MRHSDDRKMEPVMGKGIDLSEFDHRQLVGTRKAGCFIISATAKFLGKPPRIHQHSVKYGKTCVDGKNLGNKPAINTS